MVAGATGESIPYIQWSYQLGIYLLQKIPIDALKSFHMNGHPAIVLLLTAATTYLLAILSWNLLEKPALQLKRFFQTGRSAPAEPEMVRAQAS